MTDKGKGKASQASELASPGAEQAKFTATSATDSPAATATATASKSTSPAVASSGPVMHTKGDWSAVWNADVGKYYYWNRKTNTTTWTNPFTDGDAGTAPVARGSTTPAASEEPGTSTAQSTSDASTSETKAAETHAGTDLGSTERAGSTGPSPADFGGIDPDLAYLDPTLASRAKGAGGAGAYAARFNARTGRFEADPTKNPDRVSDVQRAKRQNQFYFDYDGWQATLAQQQEQNALKRAHEGEDDDASKKHRPSKKEMEAIRARNKEKRDKKQKGWLLN